MTAVPYGRHVSVFRASAAVRLPRDAQLQFVAKEDQDESIITVRTRYATLAGEPEVVPRELWVEVVGPGSDVQNALSRAFSTATVVMNAISFAMNAGIGELEPELCFDISPDLTEHEFFQNCLPDEVGLLRIARNIDVEPVMAFMQEVMTHEQKERILRAIAQYEIALQYWRPGRETFALAHLFMAMEALTPLARDREIARQGGREALLAAWSIPPKLCKHCREPIGIGDLDAEVRKRILFRGQEKVYAEAKRASDGFEHGFLNFGQIHDHAIENRDRVGILVRHAVAELLGNNPAWRDALFSEVRDAAISATPVVQYIRAVLVGRSDALQPAAGHYPHFDVQSELTSVEIGKDGTVSAATNETVGTVFAEGTTFKDARIERWGPPGRPVE